jgi:hypothetical protein
MTKRGRILRDPRFGPGLLMVEGRQYPFTLEGVWRSDEAPRPGLVVEVDIGHNSQIRSVVAVPESQLARKRAETQAALEPRKDGTSRQSTITHRLGSLNVIAVAALVVSCSLTAVSIHNPFLGKVDLTFWELLGVLNTGSVPDLLNRHGSAGAGIYGGMAVVALLGPLLPQLWKERRAALGALLPLIFITLVASPATALSPAWPLAKGRRNNSRQTAWRKFARQRRPFRWVSAATCRGQLLFSCRWCR